MDWVWSALHLDDGTHLHGVDLRIPGMPPVSVGYIQPPGEPVIETTSVSAEADIGDNGLPVATTLTFQPGPVTATIDVRGHAPVRLVAPDGRVSFFPRAWATVETADGRRGVGWLEWNRNQPRATAVSLQCGLALTTCVPPASSSCLPCLVGLLLIVTAITM